MKNTILEIPDEIKRLERNLSTQQNNIVEYETQLKQPFLYLQELTEKRQRLAEVDRIIVCKAKAEQSLKNTATENNKVRKVKL